MAMKSIKPEELHERLRSGKTVHLIDVRTPAEFQEVHAKPAENQPLDQLDLDRLRELARDSEEPLCVICKSGTRSKTACQKLESAGIENIATVEGGTQAWIEKEYDVVRGESKVISLERQVRIAAGSLVLLGVLLSWLVHIAFLGIAAFVGAGLIFAGVTDTCGMAIMLSKMPWNQVSCSKSNKTTKSAA